MTDYPPGRMPGAYHHPRLLWPPLARRVQPNADTRTVIELSDDESDPQAPPEASSLDRPRHRRLSSRESVNLPTAGDAVNGRGQLHRGSRSPYHKRARTGFEDKTAADQDHLEYHDNYENDRRIRNETLPELTIVSARQRGHIGTYGQEFTKNGPAFSSGRWSAHDASANYPKPKKETKSRQEIEKPPYYVDSRFDVKMYNGPGYERFPAVLGTIKGHKEACEKWDAEQARKLEKKAAKLRRKMQTAFVVHGSDSESPYDSDREADTKETEDKCLKSVLEVFPDIDVAFVVGKIQVHGPQPTYSDENEEVIPLAAPPLAERIIAEILELDSYPKADSTGSFGSRNAAPADGTGITITWDRDLPKDEIYLKDAVLLLAKTFDHVPTHYIHSVVAEKKTIFDSFVYIQEMEDQFYTLATRPYPRLRQPRKEIEKKYLLTVSDRRIPHQYANRINELQAARQHVAREAIQEAAKKAKEEAEAANLARHKEMGALMECQCCFDAEVPINRVVHCMGEEAHFFCYLCVEGLADTQVGMLKYEMGCMDASGCTAELSNEAVGKAIPILTFDRLALNRQQAEVRAAAIEGLEKCKWCDYQAVCDNVEKDPVFYCLNPECKRATCRKCDKDSHLPKTCEQNQRDNDLHGLHTVEEARSQAIMRHCPKCKVKIVKEFGCNKMTCTSCNTIMCYVCNLDLTALGQHPYDHFHKPGSKCVLHDEEGLNRHEQEAMRAEIEAIKKAKEHDASIDESQLRVDSGKVPKPKLDDHAAANVMYRGMNNRAGRLNNRERRIRDMQARVAVMQELMPAPEIDALLGRVHQHEQERVERMRDLNARVENLHQMHQVHIANLGNMRAMDYVVPPVPAAMPPRFMNGPPDNVPLPQVVAQDPMNMDMGRAGPRDIQHWYNGHNDPYNYRFWGGWDVPPANNLHPGQQAQAPLVVADQVPLHRAIPDPLVAANYLRDMIPDDPRRR